jgi:hypothetical protein
MITDDDLEFIHEGTNGIALVWVIDEQCLYDRALSVEHANIFLNATSVVDVSEEYPDHNGITVQLFNGDTLLETLQTSEYFGSVLLSEPQVVELLKYPYGLYVTSPHALFRDNQFIILDHDVTGMSEFYEQESLGTV